VRAMNTVLTRTLVRQRTSLARRGMKLLIRAHGWQETGCVEWGFLGYGRDCGPLVADAVLAGTEAGTAISESSASE
jgi:hypothetical protein